MRNTGLLFVFIIFCVVPFSDATAAVFSDNFEDGDIDGWTATATGSGSVAAEQDPGPDWSLNIDSPQSPETKAMAISPSFSMDESADYHVTMEFSFESPVHWVEVFRNQHINAVIDNKVGDSWRFICRYGETNHLVMTMSEYTSYNIEFRVHSEPNNYDVYVGDIFQRTCDCDPGGPAFPQFRVGDTEPGDSNYGNAMYDDFIITQPPDSDGDGIVDPNDNCPYDYNPVQEDRNSDGLGDVCECDAANLDGIGIIDFFDYSILASDWEESGIGLSGDINSDEIVNFKDLEIIAYNWLSDCNP